MLCYTILVTNLTDHVLRICTTALLEYIAVNIQNVTLAEHPTRHG